MVDAGQMASSSTQKRKVVFQRFLKVPKRVLCKDCGARQAPSPADFALMGGAGEGQSGRPYRGILHESLW